MRRQTIEPRPDWQGRLKQLGMELEAGASPYWREDACYVLDETEIDVLEAACSELVDMVDAAVDHVIAGGRLGDLGIPEPLHGPAADSWRAREPSLYGRFDLRFDGAGPPKLLEYNADTPTALFEASVVQWHWLEETMPGRDQWNSIHEGLIETWGRIGAGLVSPVAGPAGREAAGAAPRMHFACMPEDDDDLLTTAYLQDTAAQAGIDTRFLQMTDIGWDGTRFADLDGNAIDALFKLYPWDWLAREAFFPHLLSARPRLIEPAWRIIPASKGILAVLWELFPGHPNLLPASFGHLAGPVIRKPMLGREGANMVVASSQGLSVTDGPYGAMATVEQAFAPLPDLDGWHPVIGAWIVGGEARGMGIREDRALVTGRGASFVPHVIGGTVTAP